MTTDPWARLRGATPARIGLGRSGAGQPTDRMLKFQWDHARARDAVHTPLQVDQLAAELAPHPVIVAETGARDRATYLRRPDLGRVLGVWPADVAPGDYDLAFVIADGLSATAVQAHAAAVFHACVARMPGLSLAPVTIATQARVAIGDDIATRLGARLVVVLIGERPGLTVSDSLGAYLTFAPRPGRRDSERNCVSNIHGQGGLSIAAAADRIAWLAYQALRLGLTGTGLKENSPVLLDD